MAEENETQNKAVAVRPQVTSIQPLFDTDHFEHMQRAASALMHSTLLKPSIRGGSPQACFSNLMLIFEQAQRFGLPATTVAQNVDVVFDQLVYRGVLVAAMVEQRLGKLHRYFTGERGTPDYRVYVSDTDWAKVSDEVIASLRPGVYPRGMRVIDGSVAEWRTFQKKDGNAPREVNPAWVGRNTQPQLGYRGDREWCRFYEPAILLGVYGDDEIAAYAEITSVETISEDDAPITSGFAADVQAGPQAATAAEGSDTATDGGKAPAASRQPAGGGKAAPRRKSAAEVEAERVAANREEVERRFKAGEAAEEAGRVQGLAGLPIGGYPETYTPEEVNYWRNGFNRGVDEKAAADALNAGEDEQATRSEDEKGAADADAEVDSSSAERAVEADGYATGLAGKACEVPLGVAEDLAGAWRSAWMSGDAEHQTRQAAQLAASGPDKRQAAPKPPADEGGKRSANQVAAFETGHKAGLAGQPGDVPEHWEHFAGDYSEGWNAGAAERLQDQADEGDEEAEDEDAPPDPFDLFAAQITSYASWRDTKAALGLLPRTDEWKADLEAGGYRIAAARVSAGVRLQQLINENAEPADLITHDLQAFRCWSQMTEDPDLILSKYQELVLGPVWDGLEPEAQQQFERVIKARIAQLQGK